MTKHNYYIEYRNKLKAELFKAYGNKCTCCGESNLMFLTIDHIHNDGWKHKKKLKTHGGYRIYSWLRKQGYPSGYRILCFNCNCGRRLNHGVCPH